VLHELCLSCQRNKFQAATVSVKVPREPLLIRHDSCARPCGTAWRWCGSWTARAASAPAPPRTVLSYRRTAARGACARRCCSSRWALTRRSPSSPQPDCLIIVCHASLPVRTRHMMFPGPSAQVELRRVLVQGSGSGLGRRAAVRGVVPSAWGAAAPYSWPPQANGARRTCRCAARSGRMRWAPCGTRRASPSRACSSPYGLPDLARHVIDTHFEPSPLHPPYF
jgi:hypothetical protein